MRKRHLGVPQFMKVPQWCRTNLHNNLNTSWYQDKAGIKSGSLFKENALGDNEWCPREILSVLTEGILLVWVKSIVQKKQFSKSDCLCTPGAQLFTKLTWYKYRFHNSRKNDLSRNHPCYMLANWRLFSPTDTG